MLDSQGMQGVVAAASGKTARRHRRVYWRLPAVPPPTTCPATDPHLWR